MARCAARSVAAMRCILDEHEVWATPHRDRHGAEWGTSSSEVTIGEFLAEQPPPGEGLSAGALREALISAMDLGGACGANLHESKDVVIQAGDQFWSLAQVAVSFRGGRLILLLKATTT
jgi:hypothetical protein